MAKKQRKKLHEISKFVCLRKLDKNEPTELFEMPDNYDYSGKFILDNDEAIYYVFDEIDLGGKSNVSLHAKTARKKSSKNKATKRKTRR